MGYTVRVDEWRYTCWFGFDGRTQTPNRDEIIGRELYDHRGTYPHLIYSPTPHLTPTILTP